MKLNKYDDYELKSMAKDGREKLIKHDNIDYTTSNIIDEVFGVSSDWITAPGVVIDNFKDDEIESLPIKCLKYAPFLPLSLIGTAFGVAIAVVTLPVTLTTGLIKLINLIPLNSLRKRLRTVENEIEFRRTNLEEQAKSIGIEEQAKIIIQKRISEKESLDIAENDLQKRKVDSKALEEVAENQNNIQSLDDDELSM